MWYCYLTPLVCICLLSVIWTSLGKKHKELQLGKLASFATTVTICFLWTIPMAFFASLSSVEGLKEQFSWIEDAIDAAPFLEPLLKQLAPLFVVVFNSLVSVFVSPCILCLFIVYSRYSILAAYHFGGGDDARISYIWLNCRGFNVHQAGSIHDYTDVLRVCYLRFGDQGDFEYHIGSRIYY
jgi:hypothetical protein